MAARTGLTSHPDLRSNPPGEVSGVGPIRSEQSTTGLAYAPALPPPPPPYPSLPPARQVVCVVARLYRAPLLSPAFFSPASTEAAVSTPFAAATMRQALLSRSLSMMTGRTSGPAMKLMTTGASASYSMAAGTSSRLAGKVAIVTASTDGIGFAIARRLLKDGASVVVSSRKQKNVEEAVKNLQTEGLKSVTGIVCHVAKQEDRKKLFEEAQSKFGGLDILVSNAAANPAVGPVLDCDEDAWDKIFDINVKSAFLLSKEALPLLRKRGGGSIIYVASIAGLQPFPVLGAYSVSKTALLGLTKAAAQSLATENIRVNCLAPGIIKTRFAQAITEPDASRDVALQSIPMQRFGVPDEMGGVVAFLCSEDAAYITGETIVASGGMQSRL